MKFSELVRQKLLENPNVNSLSNSQIVYTLAFKENALKEYTRGMISSEIWVKGGFDISIFRRNYFQKTLSRWQAQQSRSTEGLSFKEARGRTRSKFSSLQEELAYLRAENAYLKELEALEKELGSK